VSYQVGSKGPEVEKIQKKLKERGLYNGPIDGIFGGGTEAAVRKFQADNNLQADGVVGAKTWEALFGGSQIERAGIATQSLLYRCLALTGSFETNSPIPECFSGISGDFDGQGISFGALQWNFGQGSLPPLLKTMASTHKQVFDQIFGMHADVLREVLAEDRQDQLDWARSIQSRRFVVNEPWRGQFKSLGRTAEFQKVQMEAAKDKFERAKTLATSFKLRSERGVALMFDILTQNGSISASTKAQIFADYGRIPATASEKEKEVARLRAVATRRAQSALPEWVHDVLVRKLTVAEGEGTVHGERYRLAEDYGISLNSF